jgi:hypothetical protein
MYTPCVLWQQVLLAAAPQVLCIVGFFGWELLMQMHVTVSHARVKLCYEQHIM